MNIGRGRVNNIHFFDEQSIDIIENPYGNDVFKSESERLGIRL